MKLFIIKQLCQFCRGASSFFEKETAYAIDDFKSAHKNTGHVRLRGYHFAGWGDLKTNPPASAPGTTPCTAVRRQSRAGMADQDERGPAFAPEPCGSSWRRQEESEIE